MTAGEALRARIALELAQPVSPGAHAVVERLRERFGPALRGVLFYGSCLRRGDDREGVLDLYVLVDDYRSAYASRPLAVLNRLLPPNVFSLETRAADGVVRAKYAVLAQRDLARLTSTRTFEPYFWARFSQPCALVYAADESVRREVTAALASAVLTTVARAIPLVAPRFSSRELWLATWRTTYRAELRAERPGVVDMLWANAPGRYEAVTRLALEGLGHAVETDAETSDLRCTVDLSAAARRRARGLWHIRHAHGKTLFLLRILRNALIFEGGVDYVLWKIQRHSGVEVDRTWRQRRYPLLALGAQAWRLYRARAFH
ncbi:MAG: hypothetical protein ACRERC_10715 [Candidatus Binatia bacterium]